MQWMTVTSLVPCHALHVPQHVAVSLSEPLNQMITSALQLWPAIHLGEGNSKIKPVCLDMPSPDMQRLFR